MSASQESLARTMDRVAAAIHALHGSRGLALGILGLLALSLIEPILPRNADRFWIVLPVFALFVIGGSTLAREGVAAQHRVRRLLEDDAAARKVARRLAWPALLLVLLSPRIFLAMYGIPHLNPLTGLAIPAVQQTITVAFLYFVLLVPVMYLRASRRYAPEIIPKRPRDLTRHDRSHQERDWLLWMSLALAVVWAWLLHPFWAPFSLLDWPPGLDSMRAGVRGVASITYALGIPIVLFVNMVSYLRLLRAIQVEGQWRTRAKLAWATGLHVAAILGAIVLHAYDLLWIVQYRNAVPF